MSLRHGRRAGLLLLALAAAGPPAAARAATLTLPGNAGAAPGASTSVAILVDDASGMLGTDLVVTYDPVVAIAGSVSVTALSSSHTLTHNVGDPGAVRISLYGSSPLSGAGALVQIDLTSVGPSGSRTPLAFAFADLNEGDLPAVLVDGLYCVQGRADPVRNMMAARPAGSSLVTLSWDPHAFALSYNLYRGTQGNLSDLSCFLSGVSGTSVQDGGVPPVNGMFVYLVTAGTCAGESSAGIDSAGAERTLPAACP